MTDTFEGNGGDYNSYNDEETDFKRKITGNHDDGDDPANDQPTVNDKASDYIRDCLHEKNRLEKSFPIAGRLLDSEIETVQRTGRIPSRDPKYVDIYREKPIKVAQKVLVPVREHPKFNFVGKLLGPKGNSLRRLQEETLCKMTVLGRNSMKDRAKEEELRNSLDPKYAHLNDDLHVEISTIAPPAEAHARMAYAMAELRKYLIPDSNDVIRQEQLRELMESGELPPDFAENKGAPGGYKQRPPPNNAGGPPPRGGYRQPAPSHSHPPNVQSRGGPQPKAKILSILDRARTAMDDYGRHYDEPVGYEPPAYESYGYGHAPPTSSRPPYEMPEYEPGEYRRDYYPASSPLYSDKQKMISKSTSAPSGRSAWKGSNSGIPSYHHSSSSSRRHDDMHPPHPPSMKTSSQHSTTREARYKSAPYARGK